ncbi:MAG: hypothetical protein RLZZ328_1373 [Bacteroidota bacterium]
MKYYIEDPIDSDNFIEVPSTTRLKIISDYQQQTYYKSLAIFCLIIGFLAGVLVS